MVWIGNSGCQGLSLEAGTYSARILSTKRESKTSPPPGKAAHQRKKESRAGGRIETKKSDQILPHFFTFTKVLCKRGPL